VRPRNQSLGPTTRACVIGLAAALIGLPLTGWVFFIKRMVPDGHADFRANYTAGYMLRTGKPLYDPSAELEAQNRAVSPSPVTLPFLHPAYEAIFYAPLSLLSFQRAYWVFFAVNLLALACIYRQLPELQTLRDGAWWLPAAAVTAFLPLGAALVQGQDSLMLVLLLALSFRLLKEESLLWAGMILGLGVFRFQLLLPLMLCFLLWGKWKLIAGFSITASVATAVSLALADPRRYLMALSSFRNQSSALAMQAPLSHMANLCGLIRSLGGNETTVVLASAAALILAVLAGRNAMLTRQFAITITVAALTSYYMFIHDLSVVFIPLAMLIGEGALGVAAVGFAAPALMIFAPDYFYLAIIGPAAILLSLVKTLITSPAHSIAPSQILNSPYSH
jgi:hypothetical protein